MNCAKCGQAIEPDSRFCRYCGAAVAMDAPASPDKLSAAAREGASVPNPYRDPAHEKPVWAGRPAWRAYYGWWFLWATTSIVVLYAANRNEVGPMTSKVLILVVALAAAYLLGRQTLTSLGTEYRLTTQRLIIHRGILSRVTDQTELVRVEDVRLRQSLLDRVLNTGQIEILSSDKTDDNVVLRAIGDPVSVTESVRRNVRAARGKGALFVENL
jgi:membrane protein YdbS with pleckstrin-like domain